MPGFKPKVTQIKLETSRKEKVAVPSTFQIPSKNGGGVVGGVGKKEVMAPHRHRKKKCTGKGRLTRIKGERKLRVRSSRVKHKKKEKISYLNLRSRRRVRQGEKKEEALKKKRGRG